MPCRRSRQLRYRSSELLRTSAQASISPSDAPYPAAAPLFGPEGEAPWAGKHWNPKCFIRSRPRCRRHGLHHSARNDKAVWVNTLLDTAARHFQYVYFLPEMMVTVIDVRFKMIAADVTGVNVVYTRTAFTPEGNEHVSAMTEDDKTAGKDWEQAINASLAQQKAAEKR